MDDLESQKKLDREVAEMYTPLEEARDEIWRRWKDKNLRKRVEEFLGGNIPDPFKDGPRAVLVRYITSPNFEFFYFRNLAKKTKLKPLYLEYSKDKLVARNTVKYHLCRNIFYDGKGRCGGQKVGVLKLVDFNKWEGKNLCDIKTGGGLNLVDFHHKALYEIDKGLECQIHDFSDWFGKHRKITKYYYLHYLSLFLVYGILLENFVTEEEKYFIENKIIPSFIELKKIFGIKPLIVPLEPIKVETDRRWYYYPEKIKTIFKNINSDAK